MSLRRVLPLGPQANLLESPPPATAAGYDVAERFDRVAVCDLKLHVNKHSAGGRMQHASGVHSRELIRLHPRL
jgi:hypothetical protein